MKRNGGAVDIAGAQQQLQQAHWSKQIREVTVSAQITDGHLVLDLAGGADNGRFCRLNSVDERKCVLWHGSLVAGSVVLEVQGHKVSGFTLRDVRETVENLTRNGAPIMVKTVPPPAASSTTATAVGVGLPDSLRDFLMAKFAKDSADYALQNTVRENIYLRTVPVTTRPRRQHEIDGVDYRFLTMEQFLSMERAGQMLESGVYEGNRYGTPKPSPDATGLFRGSDADTDGEGDGGSAGGGSGYHLLGRGTSADSSIRRLHSQSSNSETAGAGAGAVSATSPSSDTSGLGVANGNRTAKDLDNGSGGGGGGDRGAAGEEALPEGWEKVVDPKYGVFYIDHINKRTQYEKPQASQQSPQPSEPLPQSRSFTNGLSSLRSTASVSDAASANHRHFASGAVVTSSSQAQHSASQQQQQQSLTFRGLRRDPGVFTANPTRLAGELVTVTLVKSTAGLGITIVGGGDRGRPEFLQVKSLIPGSPAARNGRLQSGDVLVYVNETLVLGYTHEDIIGLFQQMEPGQSVAITVSTGYRLPTSASDPRAEVITKVVGGGGSGSQRSSHSGSSGLGSPGQMPPPSAPHSTGTSAASAASAAAASVAVSSLSLGRAELIKAVIARSGAGFGFTIADSPQGQRVRQIVDEERCRGLQTGDLLIEVNARRVKELPHADVVRILSDCPVGLECTFLLQRGNLPSSWASQMPASSGSQQQQQQPPPLAFRSSASLSGGLASLAAADASSSSGGVGHSTFLPPAMSSTGGGAPSIASVASASSGFSRHAPLRSSRPDTASTHVTVYPPPSSSAAAGTVPRFRSRTPGPESISHEPLQQPPPTSLHPRARTPTGLLEASAAASSSSISPPQRQAQGATQLQYGISGNSASSGATTTYGSLGRRPRSAAAVAAAATQFSVALTRNHLGLGIRILGGAEENSQVSIGQLIPGSAAHADGRIRPGDEIVAVNGQPCLGASHHRVVQLLESAGPRVSLGLRRSPVQLPPSSSAAATSSSSGVGAYPYDVTVTRRPDEGFGFVIVSSVTRQPQASAGSASSGGGVILGEFIGHVIEGSPAARCERLRQGDRILAVNGASVAGVHHEDIVRMVRDSGLRVRLTVGPPLPGQAGAPPPGLIGRAVGAPLPLPAGKQPSPADSSNAASSSPLFSVVLHKTAQTGFGFSIRGGAEFNQMPFYVLRIAEGGGAHLSGRLRVGDEIVSINDRPLAGITHTEAIQVIRSAGATLKLVCRRPNAGAGVVTAG